MPKAKPYYLGLSSTSSSSSLGLGMDDADSAESRIERLLSESPVIIFVRSSTSSSTHCICHVIKNLLATIGVHPTVVQLDEDEMMALPAGEEEEEVVTGGGGDGGPVVFIGGRRVGGLERVMTLHLSGQLVPKLVEIGAMEERC